MAEVLLFHHAQGRTSGVLAFASALEHAGHTVHVPDLFEGRVFADLASGIDHAQQTGFDVIIERGRRIAEGLPSDLVYGGFSLGVLPAQMLTQTRAGAKGAFFIDACIPVREFGAPWPPGVPVQIHAMAADKLFTDIGDLEAAQALVKSVEQGELFLYPGDRHLFADRSLPSYDESAARSLEQRVRGFLAALTAVSRA
jgi:dienelactone hydrolase